jgi:Flp pilus assembly protein TadG
MFKKLFSSNSGQVAVNFALAIVPLVVGTGMAVDFSRGAARKTELQGALDASVLAAVSVSARDKKLGVQPTDIAEQTFKAIFTSPTSALSFSEKDGIVKGYAAAKVESTFGGAVGVNFIDLSASSEATSSATRHPVCFMAMHPSRKHTLEMKQSVSVFAPDCHIYGNSDHVDDVVDPHTPQNFLTGKTVQAVGYGHHYLQNVKPPLEHAPEILKDPLASLSYPPPDSCVATGRVVTGNNQKLKPGTYCNGLAFSNAKNTELEPGTYIIKGGTFRLNNSSISGEGVTIVITGSSKPVEWSNSQLTLKAPKSGPLAGMAILADRIASSGIITATDIDVFGTIYMPNTEFDWINAGNFKPKSKWTVWIVDGISWRGTGVITINFEISQVEIPYPSELLNVIPTVGPGRARLIR